jgi:preprotein translocase SecE subunit
MAEKQPAKTKRRVKSPETFRERALKADEQSSQPKRLAKSKGKIASFLTFVFRPLGKFFKLKPFRVIAKPLRLIGKVLLPSYIRNSWKELRLVTWPSWKQSRQLTFAVLIFAVIFGAAIALVDLGLDKIFRQLLLK